MKYIRNLIIIFISVIFSLIIISPLHKLDNSYNSNYKTKINTVLNKNSDDNYFYEYIKDSSKNNIPNIISVGDVSLPIQQSFYLMLGGYYHSMDNNMNFNNEKDFSLFYTTENAKRRFNVDAINNLSSLFEDFNSVDSNNLKPFNFMFKSLMPGDNFLSYINYIVDKNVSLGFKYSDFVMSDADFAYLIKKYISNNNQLLVKILKHANRILVLTDGNYHNSTYIPFLEELKNGMESYSRDKIIDDFNKFKNDEIILSRELLVNLFQLKNYEQSNNNSSFHFITHTNYDSYKDTINPYWNIYKFDTSFYNYAENLIKNQNYKDLFLKTFSETFLFNVNNMSDILINNYQAYDKNKRNAIFLGSSLFIKMYDHQFTRLQDFENLTKAVRSQMDLFLKQFPIDEYNVIFKLHPKYEMNDAIKYVNYITDNQILDPIIINPKIAIETLIANDYYLYKKNTNNVGINNFIFRENEIYKAYEWTTFFGLQPSSTTIHTTRLFYQSSFFLNTKEVANLIPMTNFPIPVMFSTVNYPMFDNFDKNYYDENLVFINNLYKYYNPSFYFNDKSKEDMDHFIMNTTSGINLIVNNINYIYILSSVLATVFAITIIILIRNKYRNYLLKSYSRLKKIRI